MEKKCKYCAMMVPKDAAICPYCRKRLKTSPVVWFIAIVLGFSLIVSMQDMIKRTQNVTPDSQKTDEEIYREFKNCVGEKPDGDRLLYCHEETEKRYGDKKAKKAF